MTEAMTDTGLTAAKMTTDDTEQANKIPWTGGIPGELVAAMTGAHDNEETPAGGGEYRPRAALLFWHPGAPRPTEQASMDSGDLDVAWLRRLESFA
jgi:hypothetical protein